MVYNVTIVEQESPGLIDIKCRDEMRSVLEEQLDAALPVKPGSVTVTESYTIMWMASNNWLIKIAGQCTGDLINDLRNAASDDQHAAITDLSHGYKIIRLSGRDVKEILCQGTCIDLHDSEFPVFCCARTAFSKVSVILLRVDSDSYDIYVYRSYFSHLMHWLLIAIGNRPTVEISQL